MVRKSFNPKRKFAEGVSPERLSVLAAAVRYGGNPEHKRNPGDFGLTPPAAPRADKSLCDDASILRRDDALKALRAGVRRGLVSDRCVGIFPQNIWSVTSAGIALEAQLENADSGAYHGYPMPAADPLRAEVHRRWKPT